MIKTEELVKGCMAKAFDDEMTFVVMARDEVGADTIRDWCRRRIVKGLNKPGDAKITEALACADIMDTQRPEIKGRLTSGT
jgi:hypothetical protein